MRAGAAGAWGTAIALLVLAVPGASAQEDAAACPGALLQPDATNLPRVETAMVCLLNRERAGRGLGRLAVDRRLERSAAAHTRDMATYGYFAHHKTGRPTLHRRIRTTGYFKGTYTALYSENLGYGPPESATALGMHRAFMSSEGHRVNILYGRFRAVGIGSLMVGPHEAFYPDYPAAVYTIDFGRRYVRPKRCRSRQAVSSQSTPPSRSRSAPPRRHCQRRR